MDALRGGLAAFVDYVAENPDNYKSLVRGAASGDADMRAIFDQTRSTMAGRVVDVLAAQGLPLGPRAALAVHGWVAFVEECVVGSIDSSVARGVRDRDGLLDMLAKALPALVLASSDEQLNTLISISPRTRPSSTNKPGTTPPGENLGYDLIVLAVHHQHRNVDLF